MNASLFAAATVICATAAAICSPRAAAAGASEAQWGVVETAPLRGVTGAPAIRAEYLPIPGVGVGAGWATMSEDSEVEGQRNRRESLELEALWYPTTGGLSGVAALAGGSRRGGAGSWGGVWPFLGAGLKREEAWYAREQVRSAVTWARTSGSGRYDSWVDHDEYFSLSETVGVRLGGTGMVTASLRYVRDELLSRSRRQESADIRDDDAVSDADDGRGRVSGQLILHAGILLR